MPSSRVAGLVITVVAGACVALAGCGGSASSAGAAGSAAGQPNIVASSGSAAPTGGTAGTGGTGGTAGSIGRLSGNFCTDFKNIGTNIKFPTNASGSLAALQQNGVPYLRQVAAYFNGLAGEASPKAGSELRLLAGYYGTLAASIASGNINSLTKIERQMESFATKGTSGTAFHSLMAYMLSKCTVA